MTDIKIERNHTNETDINKKRPKPIRSKGRNTSNEIKESILSVGPCLQ